MKFIWDRAIRNTALRIRLSRPVGRSSPAKDHTRLPAAAASIAAVIAAATFTTTLSAHSASYGVDELRTRLRAADADVGGKSTLADGLSHTLGSVLSQQNGIGYHGGPVITGTKDVYLIWYGNWSGNGPARSSNPAAKSLIASLVRALSGSPYFNINTTYTNALNAPVSNSVALSGEITDNYSRGASLDGGGIQGIVTSAIEQHLLPQDPNGAYFVLTSGDVNTSGFLSQYCGYHTAAGLGSTVVHYAFVGDPARNINACSGQNPGPNGADVGNADAMVTVIAHELEEIATDPELNAWYDWQEEENADKCAWDFGPTAMAPNGAVYNQVLGGTPYLIQRNWANAASGYCAAKF